MSERGCREKERLGFLSQWCQQPQLTHLHGEREQKKRAKREGLRHEREAEGRGKFAGVTEAERSRRGKASGYLGERGGGLEKRQKR